MPSIHVLHKQYGGNGIPFSKLIEKKKTKKRKPMTKKAKKKPTKKQKKYSKTKKLKKKALCSCKKHSKNAKDNSPTGLGKCPECVPLHVIIKGKNGKLWENTSLHGKNTWVQLF